MKLEKNLKFGIRICMIFIILFVTIAAAKAETLIIGSGNENKVFDQENKTVQNETSTLAAELKDVLEDLKTTTDTKEYIVAIEERTQKTEKKFQDVIDTLEKSNKKQSSVIRDQSETIQDLNQKLETSKETLNTRITQQELTLQRYQYYFYLGIIISMIITVFLMEWIRGITKRKKLFFKLRKARDNFPINPAILTGGRNDD